MVDMVETNPVLYVFVRTDMPSMNAGKAQAHSGHAVSAFMYKRVIEPLQMSGGPHPLVAAWMAMTAQGFGTQINLKASYDAFKDLVEYVKNMAPDIYTVAELVRDPTYPYLVPNKEIFDLLRPEIHTMPPVALPDGQFLCFRSEVTAAYVFGDKYYDRFREMMSSFPLHP